MLPTSTSDRAVAGWVDEWDKQANKHPFLGQRYILSILVEIYPPLIAIMDSHTDQCAQKREWKVRIYRAITEHGYADIVAGVHTEFATVKGNKLASISSQLRDRLMQANAVALEFFNPADISIPAQLEALSIVQSNKPSQSIDSFNSAARLRECDAGIARHQTLTGLESHIKSFLVQNRINSLPVFISLESEKTQLQAMDEWFGNLAKDTICDAEQEMSEIDLILEGDEEEIKRYVADMDQRFPFFEEENSVHVKRNKMMAKLIPEIIKKHKRVVVGMGFHHLFGQKHGVISELCQSDGLTMQLVPWEEVLHAPSYNPDIPMTLTYRDEVIDRYLWRSNS